MSAVLQFLTVTALLAAFILLRIWSEREVKRQRGERAPSGGACPRGQAGGCGGRRGHGLS